MFIHDFHCITELKQGVLPAISWSSRFSTPRLLRQQWYDMSPFWSTSFLTPVYAVLSESWPRVSQRPYPSKSLPVLESGDAELISTVNTLLIQEFAKKVLRDAFLQLQPGRRLPSSLGLLQIHHDNVLIPIPRLILLSLIMLLSAFPQTILHIAMTCAFLFPFLLGPATPSWTASP